MIRKVAPLAVLATLALLFVPSALTQAAEPEVMLAEAKVQLLASNRISAVNNSYRKDNPNEYARVVDYLSGGDRPTGTLTRMGQGLVLLEDALRDLTPPDPPPPPPPPANSVITSQPYRCRGPVNINLLKITVNVAQDMFHAGTGCTGTILRIEAEGGSADGIKIGLGAHDLLIGGGYVFCGNPASGAHQDGMQAMGSRDIDMRGIAFDCGPGGGGNFFPAQGGGGQEMPTRITCTGCAFGGKYGNNNVQIATSVESGIRDSLACTPVNGGNPISTSGATRPVNVNNTIAPRGDARCTRQGLLEWVDD